MFRLSRTPRARRPTPRSTVGGCEIWKDLESQDQWNQFLEANVERLALPILQGHVDQVLREGCVEPLTNLAINASELEEPSSWREGLLFKGVGSRARAVLRIIADILEDRQLPSPAIYAAEAITPFALRLRGIFPRFVGSEYSNDPITCRELYPISCEDIQNLTWRSGAFDIVSTNEVLEHVPSLDRALEEIYRVLRPGGWHVGTIPFHFTRAVGARRTTMDENGNLTHLLEPEYHGDPLGGEGALVFEIPGWDIIDRARSVGFSRAFMRFCMSSKHGIFAEHVGGIFVFCCQR